MPDFDTLDKSTDPASIDPPQEVAAPYATEPSTEPSPATELLAPPDAPSEALPDIAQPSIDQPIVTARPRSRRPGGAVKGLIVASALALTFGAGVGIGRTIPDQAGGGTAIAASPSASDGELALIREAWDTIHQNYVDAKDLNDQTLAYGAINGLTDAVGDTGHTSFLTPQERQSSQSSLSGSYVGIGAEMDTTSDGLPLVVGVFRGSPADGAGLHAGDILIDVDG
jgi:carboxyl-terminal processing protease